MDENTAFDRFQAWYEECLELGIEPEVIVAKMGGMVLITDQELIERLREDGTLPD